MKSLWKWFTTLISGRPHLYIGGEQTPYMLRWFIIPTNHYFNVYLHKFVRDDNDREMHDHPWSFFSVVLHGAYIEQIGNDRADRITRRAPSIAFRRATHKHRVELLFDKNLKPIPCWTIVVTGPKIRVWGFWCPKGFVPWTEFIDQSNPGEMKRGCGE